MHLIDFLYYVTLSILSIKIIIHDIKYMLIEDGILVSMIILNIFYMQYYQMSMMTNIIQSFIVFFMLIFLRYVMNRIHKKDMLGFGDIKLLSVITFIISIESIPYIIFFSSFLALLWMVIFRIRKMPFAPSIIISTFGLFIWQSL